MLNSHYNLPREGGSVTPRALLWVRTPLYGTSIYELLDASKTRGRGRDEIGIEIGIGIGIRIGIGNVGGIGIGVGVGVGVLSVGSYYSTQFRLFIYLFHAFVPMNVQLLGQ